MPSKLFEIEHTTVIYNSLLKFVELQDFYTRYYIVADDIRRKEFKLKLSLQAFSPIFKRVGFWSYDDVAELHTKISEYLTIKCKIGNMKQL